MSYRTPVMIAVALATLLGTAAATAGSTSASVRIGARVDPVQCTPAQRQVNPRACVAVIENLAIQPAAFAVRGPVPAPGSYSVVVDTSRQVTVRTLVF